jgi:putative hydroxymethylpyrimidine transport system substrate-binding protein
MLKKILLLIFLMIPLAIYADASQSQPLTVILDWFINPDHAPLLVAEQQGFFRQQGLQVKLVQPADPMDGPKLVAAGKAEIALTYQPQLLMQVDQGLPLVRFGSLVDTPLDCLVTLKSREIRRIEDLKGKIIGYSAGGIDSAMLKTMLRQHGLGLKDVTFINVRYNLIQALLSGNIDAFTGAMRNVEPVQLNQSGHPAQTFYPEENGFPQYEELIFVTNRQMESDPRLARFLEALHQGIDYLTAHPQKSWEAAIKQHPELNNAMNKASWFASIQYFSKNPALLDKDKYRVFAEFMYQQGLIKKIPELSTYSHRV